MLDFAWIITALSLVYSLHYLISRYFVDIVTIKDKLMTEMKTDFNNCLSMVNKLPVLKQLTLIIIIMMMMMMIITTFQYYFIISLS